MCGTKRKRARARVGVSDKGLIILVALLRQANYRTRNDTWRHVTLICRIQSWVVSRENRRYVIPSRVPNTPEYVVPYKARVQHQYVSYEYFVVKHTCLLLVHRLVV